MLKIIHVCTNQLSTFVYVFLLEQKLKKVSRHFERVDVEKSILNLISCGTQENNRQHGSDREDIARTREGEYTVCVSRLMSFTL